MILEEITAHIDPEDGWKDVFLHIIERKEDDNWVSFICKGLFNGDRVGLEVLVRKDMEAGLLPTEEINQEAFYRDGICFYSIGVDSDNLLKALSTLYEFPTDKCFLESITGAMTFSLNQVDVDLTRKEKYNFKMFFNDDSETVYCEMFCNIDLDKMIVELHEKDEEYRENLIKTFAGTLE